jgi:hypothetical protein
MSPESRVAGTRQAESIGLAARTTDVISPDQQSRKSISSGTATWAGPALYTIYLMHAVRNLLSLVCFAPCVNKRWCEHDNPVMYAFPALEFEGTIDEIRNVPERK